MRLPTVAAGLATVAVVLGLFSIPRVRSATGLYDKTAQVVNDAGTILDGNASAVTGLADETIRLVDENGNVIHSFGGAPSGAAGGSLSGTYPNPTIPNNTVFAPNYAGTTWAERVNAAATALPSAGGTVDARGMCLGGVLTAADTNVILGADGKPVQLLLGTCTYPLGAHTIEYFPATSIVGNGQRPSNLTFNSQITFTGAGSALSYGGSIQSTGVYNVRFSDFYINGDSTSGSIGIDGTYLLSSNIIRVTVGGVDVGIKLGGTGTCSCYNEIIQTSASAVSTGIWLSQTANQNQIFGGAVRYSSTSGVGLQIDSSAGSNQIYSLDNESSPLTGNSFVIAGNSNAFVNPYLESTGPISVTGPSNSITGAGGELEHTSVSDTSGGTTNYFHDIGGGGGTDGVWPLWETLQDGLQFGVASSASNTWSQLTGPNDSRGPFEFTWINQSQSQLGYFGNTPVEVGEALIDGGANIHGLSTTTALGTPTAPTITQGGTAGSTSASYYVVCHDKNGGVTLPSSAGTTTTGNASLSSSNYNLLTWPVKNGCWQWDVLKADTAHSIALALTPAVAGGATHSFKDTGQSSSAYVAPTRNTTSDFIPAGGIAVGNPTGGVDASGTVNALKYETNGSVKGTVFTTTTVTATAPTAVGCNDTTQGAANVTTSMTVAVSPQTDPDGSTSGLSWSGFVSSASNVDVRICNTVVDTSPPATTYNVVVFN